MIEDTPSGGFARTLRVFGPVDEGSAEAPVILTVVLESDLLDAIEIRNPAPVVI